MALTRRQAILATVGTPMLLSSGEAYGQDTIPAIERGPLDGTFDALKAYRVPDWFRDAKFGIWSHWGPQSAAESGDWYARKLYIQGTPQYEDHVERFGHPSKFATKTSAGCERLTGSIPIT